MRAHLAAAVTLALLAVAGAAAAEGPTTLEACYRDVATTHRTPEGIQLARQLCDAAFGLSARSLAFLAGRPQRCSEWWFDRRGRYEDVDRYCSLEGNGDGSWKLACQWKANDEVTFVELVEQGDRFERKGELHGRDVGLVFRSLAACVEHQVKSGG